MRGVLIALVFVFAPPVQAGELEQMLAMFHRLQDEVVHGVPGAGELRNRIHRNVAEHLDSAESPPADVELLAQFALSGGRAQGLKRPLARSTDALSQAVVALLRGRPDDVRETLANLDTTTLATRTRALVALNLALLADGEAARPLLLRASALAPGTIIEEAALRRLVAMENRDARLAARYWRRFPHSPYRAGLEKALLAKLDALPDDDADAFLQHLLAAMPRETAAGFAIAWTRRALLAARPDVARKALKAARTFDVAKGAMKRERNRLIARVNDLAHADTARVLRQLSRIDAAKLRRQDRAMLVASKGVARAILAPLSAPAVPAARWRDSAIAGRIEQIDRLLDD